MPKISYYINEDDDEVVFTNTKKNSNRKIRKNTKNWY